MRTVEFSIPDLAEELARAATHLPPRPDPSRFSDRELADLTTLHPEACGCIYCGEVRKRADPEARKRHGRIAQGLHEIAEASIREVAEMSHT
jgi:hypothetical protein